MKFFNIDLHISVIEDIKHIFKKFGHEVTSWNLSGHNWVFGREPATIDIIDQRTWKYIDQNMCDKFYERYKDELSLYDGFIACYPPVFALLYERFNKPIFTIAATRYEYPYSNNASKLAWLDNKLRYMIDIGQIVPIANNKYDKFYCEYFLDREFTHIPSLCNYTSAKYEGIKDPIVSGRSSINGFNHITSLGKFTWADLYSHKAIIHIPYNVSIMSIFEQYAANVPLFFPTIDFGKRLQGYLSELFFMPNVRFTTELTNYNLIRLADFYDKEWMPHVIYYDSIESLTSQINNLQFDNISSNIEKSNVKRGHKISKLWENMINVQYTTRSEII